MEGVGRASGALSVRASGAPVGLSTGAFEGARPSLGASVDAGFVRAAPRPASAEARRAASAGDTGVPFSRMTGTLASKRGGGGGAATRVTTARDAAAGGRDAVASRVVMRSDARVGTTGTGPRSTGPDSIVRTTVRS